MGILCTVIHLELRRLILTTFLLPVIHEVAGAGTCSTINLSPSRVVLDAVAGLCVHRLSAVVKLIVPAREVHMTVGTEDDWDSFVGISGRRVPVEVQDPLCAAGELHRLPAQGRL